MLIIHYLFIYLMTGLSSRTHVELPYYTKYLLIAAYLASYNPAKTDRRFFAKVSIMLLIIINDRS